jgi:peptidoglycan/LPS O-acetylase OafA/YrhL
MSIVDAAAAPRDSNLQTEDPSRARSERFRGDIQGLRAFAVLAVVLNHANLTQVSGGYAGVDVFFVISGFLITDHLARRLESTGRIGFADFYARRARRILPAAFTVIALTFIVVMVALPVSLRVEALHDAIAAAAYVPNYVFAHRATNYFANPTPSLYQHYWSLGVEEQFYLVWPLLLLLAWWIASRLPVPPRWQGRAPRIALLVMAIVVGLVSISLELQAMKSNQPRAFFSAQTRAWSSPLGRWWHSSSRSPPNSTRPTEGHARPYEPRSMR